MTTTLTSTGVAVDGGSLQINGSSQIYTPNYGWLHDYFTRTVNAGNGLTGGGSGANLTISHPAYTAMTLGRTSQIGAAFTVIVVGVFIDAARIMKKREEFHHRHVGACGRRDHQPVVAHARPVRGTVIAVPVDGKAPAQVF